MKVLTKVLVSRTAKSPKSVQVEDLFFTKKEMFSEDDIKEIKEVIEKMPSLTDGKKYGYEHLSHLFNHVTTRTKTFMFMLTCLQDEDGRPMFRIDQSTGKAYVYCVKTDAEISDEDNIEAPELDEEKKEEGAADTTGDDTGADEGGSEEGAGADEGGEGGEGGSEEEKTEETGDDTGADEGGEGGSEEEPAKPLNEQLADTFKVGELRDFLVENTETSKTAANKLKEAELVAAILEGVAEEKVTEFIASASSEE